MATIKALRLRGFKSFPKQVEIPFGGGYNIVIGPNGSGKSCSYNTIITLSDGQEIKIGDLVEEKLKTGWSHRELDDGIHCSSKQPVEVLSLNPWSMKEERMYVSQFIRREGEPYLFEIITNTGKKIRTTGCHPVIVFKDGQVTSSLVKDLKEGSLIASPRVIHTNGLENRKNFARLFGYLVGDGCIRADSIQFESNTKEIINDVKDLIKKLFNATPYESNGKNNYTKLIYWQKNVIKNILDLIRNNKENYTTENKYIPNQFLNKDIETITHLLAGLFDTNGHINKKNPIIKFTTKNEKLANQVQQLLLRIGVITSKKKQMCSATNTVNKIKRPNYYLYIESQENLCKFYINIPLRCTYKKERLEKHIKNKIVPNMDIDVLPRETNLLIRKAVELLGIDVNSFKKIPRLAAYMKNRSPTREDLKIVLLILTDKLSQIKEAGLELHRDQFDLVQTMNQLNISDASVSKAISLNKQVIRDCWATCKFQPTSGNLNNFFNFISSAIESKLIDLQVIMNTLHNLANSDIFWDRVTSINNVPGEKYVYDLTIPKNHNFIGDGIFIHNSNIMDAFTFVLGKTSAKAMRAEKSASLIFHGGKKGSPAKDAQVDIIFDNTSKSFPLKEKEIRISRLVKGTGQSTYKINEDTVTKQQVLELLSAAKIDPDGHNIILQGDIVRFMEMRPNDRRELIEEIAGISVYEDKKDKAMNELTKVDTKLNEAKIILTERDTYMKELKKECDQARKYKELESNIKSNKATYINIQIKSRAEKQEEFDKKINDYNDRIKKINTNISQLKNKLSEKRSELDQVNATVEARGEIEQKRLHHDIEEIKTNFAVKESRLNVCNSEIAKINSRKKQLLQSLDSIKSKISSLKNQKETSINEEARLKEEEKYLEANIKSFREKHNLGDEINSLDLIDNKIDNLQTGITKLQENKQDITRKIDTLNFQLSKTNESHNKDDIGNIKNLKIKFKDITSNLSKSLNENSSLTIQLSNSRRKLFEIDENLQKTSLKQNSFNDFSGMDLAIKKLIDLKINGVHGPVFSLGKVPSKYSMALSVAAGPRLKSIVVDSDVTASKCIQILKEKKLGVITFLPLNKLKVRTPDTHTEQLKNNEGVLGKANELVEFNKKYSSVFSYVFGDTLVIDSIATGRKIGVGRARMVTLDGDLLETSGAMIGGFRRKSAIGGFKEKDLEADLVKLEEELTKTKKLVDALENNLELNNEVIRRSREEKSLLEAEILKFERAFGVDDIDEVYKKQKALKSELQDLEKSQKNISQEINQNIQELSKLKKLRDNAKESLKDSSVSNTFEKFDEKRRDIHEKLVQHTATLKNISQQVSDMYEPELEKTKKIIDSSEKELIAFTNESSSLEAELKKSKHMLKEKELAEKKFYDDFKGIFQKRNKLNESLLNMEQQVIQENDHVREIEHKAQTIDIDRAKIKAEIAGLEEEFKDFKDEKLRRGLSLEQLRSEINKFEHLIQNIGSVNLRALDVFETAEKEYNVILDKASKLNLEKDDVLRMMSEIDSQKKDLFMKTFKVLHKNFKNIFSNLSTKGEAHLIVEDEDNIFETGVDIQVHITGSKYLDIKSLSGGEKTMAALAFIFAIQDMEPAAFYLLDEVDAALDKKNSELLSKLIKKYSSGAQYIVVSHNDTIINEADQIYGISMQDAVSKIVSLKL